MVERLRAGWAGMKGRWDDLLKEFGVVALAVHYTIFFATWFGFWLAIKQGVAIEGVAADAGTVGGSCVATQATKPVRLPLTLFLTPLVVGLYRRFRGGPDA